MAFPAAANAAADTLLNVQPTVITEISTHAGCFNSDSVCSAVSYSILATCTVLVFYIAYSMTSYQSNYAWRADPLL